MFLFGIFIFFAIRRPDKIPLDKPLSQSQELEIYPDPGSGTIDAPIGRHPGADYRFAVIAGGKPSVTHYDTLEMFRSASLLRIELERTKLQ
jgi:hypothetical protein